METQSGSGPVVQKPSRGTAVNDLGGDRLPLVEGEHVLLGAWLREVRRRARAEARASDGRGDQRVAASMRALAEAVEDAAAGCEDSYARQFPDEWHEWVYGERRAKF